MRKDKYCSARSRFTLFVLFWDIILPISLIPLNFSSRLQFLMSSHLIEHNLIQKLILSKNIFLFLSYNISSNVFATFGIFINPKIVNDATIIFRAMLFINKFKTIKTYEIDIMQLSTISSLFEKSNILWI